MKNFFGTARTFLVVLFLGLFAMTARNVTDPDIWWHLRTGQYILEHKGVPHTDAFSYTRARTPWVAHEWLTEVMLYDLQRIAGWSSLIVVFAAVLAATFFLLYLRCGPSTYIAGIATLGAALASMPVWGVRPQVLSLLLTSLWLLILERSERNPRLLWWTLPLTFLWVNLHAGFALGLALSGLCLIGEWIEGARERSQSGSRLRNAAFILMLDLLIVPLNPNGVRLFWYPIETLRSAAMQSYILEWASPNFHRAQYWPFMLIALATFAVLAWSKCEVRPRDVLLLVVSLYAGLCSIRMIPLFVLIAIPLLCQRLGTWRGTKTQVQPTTPRVLLNSAIVLAMTVFAGVHVVQIIHRQSEAEKQQFPSRAVVYLQAHALKGPIFNHYDWGGYLIWKLYPAVPVFIDGRADLYGEQLFDQFAETYQFKASWQRRLQDWGISTVLVPRNSALATGLRSAPGWDVSYEDGQAVILTATSHAASTTPTPGK